MLNENKPQIPFTKRQTTNLEIRLHSLRALYVIKSPVERDESLLFFLHTESYITFTDFT